MHCSVQPPAGCCAGRRCRLQAKTVAHGFGGVLYTAQTSPGHAQEGHPECPERVAAILSALQQQQKGALPVAPLAPEQMLDPGSPSVRRALTAVHPESYLDRLDAICRGLQRPQLVDDSTFIAPGSYGAALQVTAALLSLVDAVVAHNNAAAAGASSSRAADAAQGTAARSWRRRGAADAADEAQGRADGSVGASGYVAGFCLCRPPGHHVLPSRPMGFGVANFVSVAAEHLLQRHSATVKKVAILDFDVHHGNGTEEIFYRRPDVLYVSVHQQGLWPYTGKAHQCGAGAGLGATINLPVPGGAGHESVALLLERVVGPAVRAFQPDAILASAGYDAHHLDPLAGLQYEPRTYRLLGTALAALGAELCEGRLVLVLEGGYHVASLPESVIQTCAGLTAGSSPLAQHPVVRLQEEPLEKLAQLISSAARLHSRLLTSS